MFLKLSKNKAETDSDKRPLFIANWKMNLTAGESKDLALAIKADLKKSVLQKEVVLCPSFTSLFQVGEAIRSAGIFLGAQDVFWEADGAFTGEISPVYLKSLGCRYVIVGHSERRHYLGETDEMINKKIDSCLSHGLAPILCVGETIEERQEGLTDNVLWRQLTNDLRGIDLVGQEQLVIAYEPIWAIGSGQAASGEEAEAALKVISQVLRDLFPLTIVNNNIRLIYGGSIEPSLVDDFSGREHLSGFLVGGASLRADKFCQIIDKFNI